MPKETPSQTAGPYLHLGCAPNACGIGGVYPADLGARLATGMPAERIWIRGVIRDGLGAPVTDALIEVWQADASGRYPADRSARGWGRTTSDSASGEFAFRTVKPGRVPFPDGRLQAPHVTIWIAARGINVGLHTRMCFPDEAAANAEDPVLARIEQAETLIAAADGRHAYRFEIRLQGERETVFFDA